MSDRSFVDETINGSHKIVVDTLSLEKLKEYHLLTRLKLQNYLLTNTPVEFLEGRKIYISILENRIKLFEEKIKEKEKHDNHKD